MRFSVGAGLLATAAEHSALMRLVFSFREQARSHRKWGVAKGLVRAGSETASPVTNPLGLIR
jgi:hypothetical protein